MRSRAWVITAILIVAAGVASPGSFHTARSVQPSVRAAETTLHLMPPDPRFGSWPAGTVQGALSLGPRSATVGTARILVLLIEFTDVVHNPAHDSAFFDRFFNDGAPGARSMRAFYSEASYGALTINATIVPTWFVSNHTMAYYGQDGPGGVDSANGPIYNLVTEAVRAADPSVNFSAFDTDRDGVVDHILVVHAGPGQEDHTNRTDFIWSHSWAVLGPSLVVDGVQVYRYTMISEDSPLGVPVHEFGHDLGLPDLYDTDFSSDGAGIWDVMSLGPWNGAPRGSSPAMFSAWSRIRLGWLTPTSGPLDFAEDTPIPAVETHPFAYRLPVPGSTVEYFLIENREPIDFDAALPAYGLLIWHVDDSQPDNTVDTHRLLGLVEADGGVNGDHPTDAGDPWHDTAVGFGPDTNPRSTAYNGIPTTWRVRDISAIGDPMTATILNAVPVDLAVQEIRVPSMVAVGASVTAHVIVRNEGTSPANATLSLRVYRDVLSLATLVLQSNRTLAIPSGSGTNQDITFSATALARYLIDAAISMPGDAIPSDDERVAHVSTNVFAFRDDMEAGAGRWTVSGTPQDNPRWTVLNASAANGSAHTGWFAWRFGYGLNATVNPTSPPWRAITSAIVSLTGPAYLIFYHRFDVSNATDSKSPGSAVATVQARYGGGPWSALAAYSGRSMQWGGVAIPLAPATFPTTVEVRFNATSGNMPHAGGWWIDDVAIASRGLAHAVAVTPASLSTEAIGGIFASARIKIVNVGDYQDAFVANGSVPVGFGIGFAPPGGLPTLAKRTIVLAPDRDTMFRLAIAIPPGTAPGSYLATVFANGPANATATAVITVAVPGESTMLFVLLTAIAAVVGGGAAIIGFLVWRRRARQPPT